jgi:hypothetical protein
VPNAQPLAAVPALKPLPPEMTLSLPVATPLPLLCSNCWRPSLPGCDGLSSPVSCGAMFRKQAGMPAVEPFQPGTPKLQNTRGDTETKFSNPTTTTTPFIHHTGHASKQSTGSKWKPGPVLRGRELDELPLAHLTL